MPFFIFTHTSKELSVAEMSFRVFRSCRHYGLPRCGLRTGADIWRGIDDIYTGSLPCTP